MYAPPQAATTSCSIAPKIEWPAASSIQIRTRVAGLEEGRRRLAVEDGLDGADLGEAGIALAAAVDRLARAAVRVAVGDRARAEDRAGAEVAGLGEMGDERAEIEGHVLAGVGAAEGLRRSDRP